MIVRTPEERTDVIEAGKRFGVILEKVMLAARPGISTTELDSLAEKLIREGGDIPPFKGYKIDGASKGYPASLCVSVNDEVVHGVPSSRVLKEGDIVSLDLGLSHKGFIMDSALTMAIGKVSNEVTKLMQTTQASLEAGIKAAKVGNHIGDISHATGEAFRGTKFSVVKVLGGHGVGREVHEEPYIANEGHAGTGPEIVTGMVLAIEPIANLGKASVLLDSDGFTFRTRDGSLSVHFEHTILVEEEGTIVLTRRPGE